MRAAQPDWIFATGYINDLILIRKQMKDLGVGAPVVTMIAGPAYKEYIDAVGPLGGEHFERGVVASGRALRRQGRVRLDRELQQALEREEQGRAGLCAGTRPRRPARCSSSRSRKPARSIRPRCATRSPRSTPRPSSGASSSVPPARSAPLDPPVFQLQGGKPVVIFPDYVKQADFKFGVQ